MLISDLAAVLRPRVTEVPNIMLNRVMTESIREFYRMSRAWRISFTGAIVSGSASYSFTLPTDSLVYDILYAKLTDSNRNITYLRDAHDAYLTPDEEVADTGAQFVTLDSSSVFTFTPIPNVDDTLDMRVVLNIPRTATNVDDGMVEEFEDALVDGALYRLYEMPNESWSSIRLSAYHRQKFIERAEVAKLRAEQTRTPGVRIAGFSW